MRVLSVGPLVSVVTHPIGPQEAKEASVSFPLPARHALVGKQRDAHILHARQVRLVVPGISVQCPRLSRSFSFRGQRPESRPDRPAS